MECIDGITVDIDADAVVLTSASPLPVVSTAAVGGGFVTARTLVNLHVTKDFAWQDLDRLISSFARARSLPAPWVGLTTAARTQKAEVVTASIAGVMAMAVVTVGLTEVIAAGVASSTMADDPTMIGSGRISGTQPATDGSATRLATAPRPRCSTINTIVVVSCDATPEAMVNLVATVAEAKVGALAAAGVRCPSGAIATGTATDATVIAATGRGPRHVFGGPISDLGHAVAFAARRALERGIDRWLEEHR